MVFCLFDILTILTQHLQHIGDVEESHVVDAAHFFSRKTPHDLLDLIGIRVVAHKVRILNLEVFKIKWFLEGLGQDDELGLIVVKIQKSYKFVYVAGGGLIQVKLFFVEVEHDVLHQ